MSPSTLAAAGSAVLLAAVGVVWAVSYASAVGVSDGRVLVVRVDGPDADAYLWSQRQIQQRPAADVWRRLRRRSGPAGGWDRAGFGYAAGAAAMDLVTVTPTGGQQYVTYSWRLFAVPLWPVAAALAVPPGAWLLARARRRRRVRAGMCTACGYDLRATPEGGALLGRCPECGAVPSVPAAGKGAA
jgi:hypothetical protein